ncbi:MAG TPA: hypothetical protein V6D06_16615 [Trichocoleus sp.]
MNAPTPRRKRPTPSWRRMLDRANATTTPWLWMTVTLLLYGSAGLVLSAFPVPYWFWTVALAGTLLQAVALAGPHALQRLRRFPAEMMSLLGILGAAALAAALSAALNYAGSPDLNGIDPIKGAFEVALLALAGLLLAGFCAVVSAKTGDRLIVPFKRLQACLILAATAVLGLGLGGAVGLLATRF